MATSQPSSNFLNRLPNELLLRIMLFLSPEYSACLGVTYRRLYAVHRRLNGTVPLYTPHEFRESWETVDSASLLQLCQLLHDWIDPDGKLIFDTKSGRFVTWETWWEIMAVRFENSK